jgi:hypothetical protein
MWPFAVRIVDDSAVAWQLRAFEWLVTNLADGRSLAETTLVLPGQGHFVSDGETGHALALRIFAQIKTYVRVEETTEIDLVQQPPRLVSIVGEQIALQHERPEPLGTCRVNDAGRWELSYDPGLLADPENLISTLVHELGHVMVPPSDDLPVEPDEYEMLIDLCVAFFGFGVFLSNTRAERITDGAWSWWRGGGYLPINDRLLATALFIKLKGDENDRAAAQAFLRPEWRAPFGKAFRQLDRFESEIRRLCVLDRDIARSGTVRPIAG